MNNNLKIFIGFILGMVISYSTVAIADTYINSNEVYYDNETSGGTYTNVKESIDELYNLASHNGSTFGDAIASDILSGKTALSGGEEITGSMVNNGGVTKSIGVGETYTIPQGYHDGTGVVTGPTLSGTAGVGDVRSGKTFYNTSGSIKTGTWNPSPSVSYVSQGYCGNRTTSSWSATISKAGTAIVVVRNTASAAPAGYTVYKNGSAVGRTGGWANGTNYTAYYFISVAANDRLTASFDNSDISRQTFLALFLASS
jgi:hypothetical protein